MGLFDPRTAFKPFEYPDIVAFQDAINNSFWKVSEFNFTGDTQDYHTVLDPVERSMVTRAVLAISQIEVDVKEFWGKLGDRFPKAEFKQVGATFAESEVRHANAYSQILEVLGLNDAFRGILEVPAIKGRVEYLKENIAGASKKSNQDFALTLSLFSMFVENVSLFSQFLIVRSLHQNSTALKDIDNVIQATQQEETVHALFGAWIVNRIRTENPTWFDAHFHSTMKMAAMKAYGAECAIVEWIFENGEPAYISKAIVREFIKKRFNDSMKMIGLNPIFDVNESLLKSTKWFDKELKARVSTDFFNKRPTTYTKHTNSCKAEDLFLMSTDPKYPWANDLAMHFLRKDNLLPGQTLDERMTVICNTAGEILQDPTFADEFKSYLQQGFYSLSSPVLTNFGHDRGLPISCFGSYISDTMSNGKTGILDTLAEVGMMTKNGGGTSGYFGDLRHRGAPIKNGANGLSSGPVHFMQLYDSIIEVVSQGSTRRGQFAAYLPIDHPDALEFMKIKSDGHKIQNMSFGVCVDNAFMHRMISRDPQACEAWAAALDARRKTGYPYIIWTDNANDGAADVYKDLGLRITHSNLCTEIMEPDNIFWSFVCCLGSMNILTFDIWRHTNAVARMVQFLDAVMSEFIEKASTIPHMGRAVQFAKDNRALGLGQLGWHSYLQSKNIPFESMEAKYANIDVAKTIRDQAYAASQELGARLGYPDMLKPYKRRNATLIAIAPTKSSSFIFGQVSEGIQPIEGNVVVKDLQKGKYELRNPALEKVLEAKGQNTEEVWDSINDHRGSILHLDFLSEHEKNVFRTFDEISPKEILIQAAQRQKYIDQAQSINLVIHPDVPIKDINALMISAWEMGIKSLYYQINENAAQEFVRNINTCRSCEG